MRAACISAPKDPPLAASPHTRTSLPALAPLRRSAAAIITLSLLLQNMSVALCVLLWLSVAVGFGCSLLLWLAVAAVVGVGVVLVLL
eukprot:COSAG03_NODE_2087_length_3143_cov_33.161629_4_plen_86_part_01